MKKLLITFAVVLMSLLVLFSVNVFAEPTNPAPIETQAPPVSDVPTEPVYTEPTVETTIPVYTDPTGTGVETWATEVPTTEFVRPTEDYEVNPPSTESYYYATNSLIDAGEYKGEAEDWKNIDEKDIIALKGDTAAEGAISFKDLKNDNTGDENEYLFLVLGIICIVLGTIGTGVFIFTFVKKKPKTAKATAASAHSRQPSARKKNQTTVRSTGERTRRRHDDYNDGY